LGLAKLKGAVSYVVAWGESPLGLIWREVWLLEDRGGRRARAAILFWEEGGGYSYDREVGFGTRGAKCRVESVSLN